MEVVPLVHGIGERAEDDGLSLQLKWNRCCVQNIADVGVRVWMDDFDRTSRPPPTGVLLPD